MKNLISVNLILALSLNLNAQNVPNGYPTNGLVGYWSLTDSLDAVGSNHLYPNSAIGAFDRFGNANSAFDIASTYLTIPYEDYLDSNSLTISFWIKDIASSSSTRCFFKKGNYGNATNEDYYFGLKTNNTFDAGFKGNNSCSPGVGWVKKNSTNTYNNFNQWSHIVFSHISDTLKVYRDNQLVFTDVIDEEHGLCNPAPLYFGSEWSGNTAFLNGVVDDIGIWNRELSPYEIQNLFSINYSGNWFVSKTGNDQNSGSNASPFLTIQTAIDSAAPGDIIYVSSGSYSSFEIKKNVTVIGTGLTKPVIDGGDSTRCIEIIDTKAKIQNLRLENGYAPQTYNWNRGACLYAQYDSVWIENCDFYAGYASGGGDYYGGGGLPTFINCRFLDNTTAATQYLGSMFFVDNGQSANFYNCLINARGYQNIFEVGYTYRVYNSTITNLEGQLYRSPWQNHEFTFVNNIVTELGSDWEVFPDTAQGFWGSFEGDVIFKSNRLPEVVNSYTYSQGGEVVVTFCDTNDVASRIV